MTSMVRRASTRFALAGFLINPIPHNGTVPMISAEAAAQLEPCADSHGDYWWYEYWDQDLACVLPLDPGDRAIMESVVQPYSSGICDVEVNWLINQATLYEWTGNYWAGYDWAAWYRGWDQAIGFQWPFVGEAGYWFHEAAHWRGYWDESQAWARANDCMTLIPPSAQAASLTLPAMTLLSIGIPQSPEVPITSPSPRLAAMRYALSHGFEVPRTNVAVASEAGFERGRARISNRSTQDLAKEARELASLIGPTISTVRASDVLHCPSSGACYASTRLAVLVVEEPYPEHAGVAHPGGPNVYVKLFTPANDRGDRATLYHTIVLLERRDSGWIGTGYDPLFPPKRIIVR